MHAPVRRPILAHPPQTREQGIGAGEQGWGSIDGEAGMGGEAAGQPAAPPPGLARATPGLAAAAQGLAGAAQGASRFLIEFWLDF